MKILPLLLLFISATQLFSQNQKPDTVFCDCNVAAPVIVNGKSSTKKTIPPIGPGVIDEISSSKQNTKYAFEKEHHSAWYKLIINASGKFTFDIIPLKCDDDYDFMLFKAGNTHFCDSLLKYKIKPVRACISRDKEEIKGKTGLNRQSTEQLIKEGVASAYGKLLEVKKGEVYYLVLDNVYEEGGGHRINFEISEIVNFNGTVTNEHNQPIATQISLTNHRGDVVLLTKTDPQGAYTFTQTIVSEQNYALNFYNDSTFNYTKAFTLDDTLTLKSLKTLLPKLKKGSKYSVGSINFYGSSVEYLPRSLPAMNNLAKLLNKNPKLKIMIIGHSNGSDGMHEKGIISFTKGRARSIRNYLAIQGINENRITIDGKGDKEMLFPLTNTPTPTEAQQEENRRVEILVTEY